MCSENSKPALKFTHLSKEVRPIIACLIAREDEDVNVYLLENNILFYRTWVENVDIRSTYIESKEKNFKSEGYGTYVISSINNSDKFSKWLVNCTGIVVAGREMTTGENISFLSHENPKAFLGSQLKHFKKDIRSHLGEINRRCFPGTVDAVIVGGNYYLNVRKEEEHNKKHRDDYRDSIALLSQEIADVLGFDPIIITGPKIVPNEEHIFYNNEERRLHIFRPKIGDVSSESYVPGKYVEQEKKWITASYALSKKHYREKS